jgi:hypothetical protein
LWFTCCVLLLTLSQCILSILQYERCSILNRRSLLRLKCCFFLYKEKKRKEISNLSNILLKNQKWKRNSGNCYSYNLMLTAAYILHGEGSFPFIKYANPIRSSQDWICLIVFRHFSSNVICNILLKNQKWKRNSGNCFNHCFWYKLNFFVNLQILIFYMYRNVKSTWRSKT